jgi:iron complex transport system substrate-binding protein
MRIVSLLPSATEMICAVGLEEQLVGVTHECDFPPRVRDLPKVTRTLIPADAASAEIDRLVREHLRTKAALYSLDLPALAALRPELIVTQALCDVCAVAEEEVRAAACSLGGARVVNLAPQSLSDVLSEICRLAEIAGVAARGENVVAKLRERVDAVEARSRRMRHRPRIALLEWLDPPFSCGHWNPELVRLAGGVEGLGISGKPSQTLNWDEVHAWQPEVVFIACCGYSAERAMQDAARLPALPQWSDLPAVRTGRVYVADGSQYFNRPGPRLVDSLEILAHAFAPDVHFLPPGLRAAVRAPEGG